MITGKNFIGNTLTSLGDVTFKTFNPQTNTANDTLFTEASTVEIEKAIALATTAFSEFNRVSPESKSDFLNEIANEIEKLDDELINTYCMESGLPEGRAKGERGRTLFQLRMFADLVKEGSWVEASIDTANPDRTPMPKEDIRKMNIPLGPVVVFGASNFPLAYSTAGGDTAAALAAGCPVIVKSHPMHAGTGELVASAIIKAAEKTGMPNGVFSNLNSSGIEVGGVLVSHPMVKAVGFTGSIRGGRALYDLASRREEPIPVFAEMGSINPVILLPGGLKDNSKHWATVYAGSITLGSGQFCTNPGLILGIKGEKLTDFIMQLSEAILPLEPGCMLHPDIVGAYESNRDKMLEQSGVKSTIEIQEESRPNYGRQLITTVEGSTFLANPTLHQEVFGPFSLVVQCSTIEELLAIIAKLEGQLTGTIIASEAELTKNQTVVAALQNRVGRIIFNGVPTGVEVCESMVHGGPYPASTDSRFTAVGVNSIKRWVRPFSFQNWPDNNLPDELKNSNPYAILRSVNGTLTNTAL